jgi:hypothetical protein
MELFAVLPWEPQLEHLDISLLNALTIKLFLCAIKYHIIKMYEDMKVELQPS